MPTVHVAAKFQVETNQWQFGQYVATGDKDWASRGLDFNTAIAANIVPLLGADCEYVGSQWSDVIERDTAGTLVPVEVPTLGGGAPSLPSAAPIVVTCFNGAFGRGKQGRMYVSGVPNDQYEGDDLTPDAVTAFQAGFDAFFAALVAANIVPLTARMLRTAHPPTLIGSDNVQRYIVRPFIRSQRRRQQGRSIRH